jgi:glucokinase
MAGPAAQILLADIGATNARFALLRRGGEVGPVHTLAVADYPQFTDATTAFLAAERAPLAGAVLAVAGPVEGERAVMTNCPWVIDAAELRRVLAVPTVHVINDFEATAWSLGALEPDHVVAVGFGRALAGAPMVVLGPGTGLGLACHLPRADAPVVIATEGGHVTLAPSTPREDAVVAWLRGRFGHASAERALSGAGLENLYRAIAALDGTAVPERDATAITKAGVAGTCPVSRAALDMFCAMLGTFAGNAALSFGARGGVFIAGGIAPRIVDYLLSSELRARFDAKGRFRAYMEAIPLNVIVHPDYAFIGLKSLVERSASLVQINALPRAGGPALSR